MREFEIDDAEKRRAAIAVATALIEAARREGKEQGIEPETMLAAALVVAENCGEVLTECRLLTQGQWLSVVAAMRETADAQHRRILKKSKEQAAKIAEQLDTTEG